VIYSREQYVRKEGGFNECKKVVTEFEERKNIKIRKWKKLEITKERYLRKLLGNYTVKILLDRIMGNLIKNI